MVRVLRVSVILPLVLLSLAVSAATINVPADQPTITAAIAAAAAGDTILVANGTYAENLVVNKAVTIAGASQAGTIVRPAVSGPTCPPGWGSLCPGASNVFLVGASGVTIRDLTIDGDNPSLTSGIVVNGADVDARNGIIEDYPTGVVNNLTVHHTTIRSIYLRGVYNASGGSGFYFHHNTVDNVAGSDQSIGLFSFAGSGKFESNIVSRANDGISANHSRGIEFTGNTVTDSFSAIHSDNAGDSGGIADLIDGNTVVGTAGSWGIWVFVPYIAPVVQNNTITSADVGIALFGNGVTPAAVPLVKNNVITGNNAVDGAGVYVTTDQLGWAEQTTGLSLVGNTITGNAAAMKVDETNGKSAAVNAKFNRIQGNGAGIVNGGATTVVAENNWWGCNYGAGATGAGCAATTNADSGLVDADPWLELDIANGPPATMQIGWTVTVADEIFMNSDGVDTSALGHVPDGIPVAFSAGGIGSFTPPVAPTLNGTSSSMLTAGPGFGAGSAAVQVDDQTVSAELLVAAPASIPTLDTLALAALAALLALIGLLRR